MFDLNFYIFLYPELMNIFNNDKQKIYNHWINIGQKEGKIGYHIDEKKFNWVYYINENKLKKENILTEREAIKHWYTIGKKQELKCCDDENEIFKNIDESEKIINNNDLLSNNEKQDNNIDSNITSLEYQLDMLQQSINNSKNNTREIGIKNKNLLFEIDRLKTLHNNNEKLNKELTNKNIELNQEYDRIDELNKNLINNLNLIKSNYSNSIEKNKKIVEDYKKNNTELDNYNKKYDELNENNIQILNSIEKIKKDIINNKNDINEIEKSDSDKKNKLLISSLLKENYDNILNNKKKYIEKIEIKIKNENLNKNSLKQHLNENIEKEKELFKNLNEIEKDILYIKSTNQNIKNSIEELNHNLNEKNKKLDEIEKENEKLEEKMEKINIKDTTINNEIEIKKIDIKKLKNKIDEKENEKSILYKNYNELNDEIYELSDSLNKISSSIKHYKDSINQKEIEKYFFKFRINYIYFKNSNNLNKLDILNDEVGKLELNKNEYSEEYENNIKKINSLEKQKKIGEIENKKYIYEIENQGNNINNLKSEIYNITKNIELYHCNKYLILLKKNFYTKQKELYKKVITNNSKNIKKIIKNLDNLKHEYKNTKLKNDKTESELILLSNTFNELEKNNIINKNNINLFSNILKILYQKICINQLKNNYYHDYKKKIEQEEKIITYKIDEVQQSLNSKEKYILNARKNINENKCKIIVLNNKIQNINKKDIILDENIIKTLKIVKILLYKLCFKQFKKNYYNYKKNVLLKLKNSIEYKVNEIKEVELDIKIKNSNIIVLSNNLNNLQNKMNILNNNNKIYSILIKKIQCILFLRKFKLNYYKDSIIKYINDNKNYNDNINDLETNIKISNKEYKFNKYMLESTTNRYNLLTNNKNIINNNNNILISKINEIINCKKNLYIRLVLIKLKNNYYSDKLLLETNNKNDYISKYKKLSESIKSSKINIILNKQFTTNKKNEINILQNQLFNMNNYNENMKNQYIHFNNYINNLKNKEYILILKKNYYSFRVKKLTEYQNYWKNVKNILILNESLQRILIEDKKEKINYLRTGLIEKNNKFNEQYSKNIKFINELDKILVNTYLLNLKKNYYTYKIDHINKNNIISKIKNNILSNDISKIFSILQEKEKKFYILKILLQKKNDKLNKLNQIFEKKNNYISNIDKIVNNKVLELYFKKIKINFSNYKIKLILYNNNIYQSKLFNIKENYNILNIIYKIQVNLNHKYYNNFIIFNNRYEKIKELIYLNNDFKYDILNINKNLKKFKKINNSLSNYDEEYNKLKQNNICLNRNITDKKNIICSLLNDSNVFSKENEIIKNNIEDGENKIRILNDEIDVLKKNKKNDENNLIKILDDLNNDIIKKNKIINDIELTNNLYEKNLIKLNNNDIELKNVTKDYNLLNEKYQVLIDNINNNVYEMKEYYNDIENIEVELSKLKKIYKIDEIINNKKNINNEKNRLNKSLLDDLNNKEKILKEIINSNDILKKNIDINTKNYNNIINEIIKYEDENERLDELDNQFKINIKNKKTLLKDVFYKNNELINKLYNFVDQDTNKNMKISKKEFEEIYNKKNDNKIENTIKISESKKINEEQENIEDVNSEIENIDIDIDKSDNIYLINIPNNKTNIEKINMYDKQNLNTNIVKTKNISINYKYDESPLINILTRTSNRPNYFSENRYTILSQTYKNIRQIISVDNNFSYNYVKCNNVLDDNILILKSKTRMSKKHMPYNLYCNNLLDKVNNGWIMFMDDDDILYDEYSIESLLPYLNSEDNILVWKCLRNNEIYPSNFGYKIKKYDIGSNSFMFNVKYVKYARWDDMEASDFRFINKLVNHKKTKVIWVDHIISKINNWNIYGRGAKMDKPINKLFDPMNVFLKKFNQINSELFPSKNIEYFEYNNKINNNDLNNIFDKIYILNLSRRSDRWNNMKYRLTAANIISCIRYLAVDGELFYYKKQYEKYKKIPFNSYDKKYNRKAIPSVGSWCILLSMHSLLSNALKNNYSKILVLQDDCLFHKNFNYEFNYIYNNIKSDWKLLYLGCSQKNWSNIQPMNNLYHPSNTDGAFAIGIDKSIYKILLSEIEKMQAPFDSGPLQFIQNKYRKECYVMYPNIIIADLEDSDCRKSRNMAEWGNIFKWNINNFNLKLDNKLLLEKNNEYCNDNKEKNYISGLVSIIVTCYNSSKYIIHSIESLMKQSYKNIEIIIIDDDSKDNTMQHLEKLVKIDSRIKVIRNDKNYGTYISKNIGIKYAKGEFITFNDSDDASISTRISTQIKFLNKEQSYYGCVGCFISRSKKKMSIAEISLFIRHSLIDKIGYFDSVRVGADTEFRKRAVNIGCDIFVIKKYLYTCLDRLMEGNSKGKISSLTCCNRLGISSNIRLLYRKQFEINHELIKNNKSNYYVEFPQYKRLFSLPFSDEEIKNYMIPELSETMINHIKKINI